MKKLLFIAAVLLVSTNSFAKDKSKEKNQPNANVKEKAVLEECCTATLTYNGAYVDHRTVCGMITTGDNCNIAKEQLLEAHPEVPRLTES
jgi:hypothetical protein